MHLEHQKNEIHETSLEYFDLSYYFKVRLKVKVSHFIARISFASFWVFICDLLLNFTLHHKSNICILPEKARHDSIKKHQFTKKYTDLLKLC